MKTHGADILRLWVVSGDYTEDLRIGKEILDGIADTYRRLRNTLRYHPGQPRRLHRGRASARGQMPELERWVLHRLAELDELVRSATTSSTFRSSTAQLHNFCAVDLSAFYFDVRKDALYCDPLDSVAPPRRAHRARRSCSAA